jgi:hypothetical protein
MINSNDEILDLVGGDWQSVKKVIFEFLEGVDPDEEWEYGTYRKCPMCQY